jgi:hypothetical protein
MTDVQKTDKEQTHVDEMRAESKELGFKSPFDDLDEGKKADETAKPDKEESEESKPEDGKKPDESRQPRVPTSERKERSPSHLSDRIREGVEKKLGEKYDKELNDLRIQLAEAKKGNLTPAENKELEADIDATAKALNVKPEQLREIVKLSRKSFETELKTLQDKVAKYESKTQDDEIAEQEEIFNSEWEEVTPSIQEQFPNASKEQLAKAQDHMDELAHSEKYQNYDLDYILFKEKAAFEKILFSPKKKGFESGATPERNLDEDEPEVFSGKAPKSVSDFEKMDKATKAFEESLPDTRFSIK